MEEVFVYCWPKAIQVKDQRFCDLRNSSSRRTRNEAFQSFLGIFSARSEFFHVCHVFLMQFDDLFDTCQKPEWTSHFQPPKLRESSFSDLQDNGSMSSGRLFDAKSKLGRVGSAKMLETKTFSGHLLVQSAQSQGVGWFGDESTPHHYASLHLIATTHSETYIFLLSSKWGYWHIILLYIILWYIIYIMIL